MSPNTDEFLDLLASSQSRRLDDQRASFSNLPGLRLTKNNNQSVLERLVTNDKKEPDEDFFDILVKCQVRVHTHSICRTAQAAWAVFKFLWRAHWGSGPYYLLAYILNTTDVTGTIWDIKDALAFAGSCVLLGRQRPSVCIVLERQTDRQWYLWRGWRGSGWSRWGVTGDICSVHSWKPLWVEQLQK